MLQTFSSEAFIWLLEHHSNHLMSTVQAAYCLAWPGPNLMANLAGMALCWNVPDEALC